MKYVALTYRMFVLQNQLFPSCARPVNVQDQNLVVVMTADLQALYGARMLKAN